MAKEKYIDYMRSIVVAYDKEMKFYENCGFEKMRIHLLCI